MAKRKRPCLYGNWCGPACSGPGKPIDDLDYCCKMHDRCYQRRGYFSCQCDKALLNCVRSKINSSTKKGKAAGAIYRYFNLQTKITCPPPFYPKN